MLSGSGILRYVTPRTLFRKVVPLSIRRALTQPFAMRRSDGVHTPKYTDKAAGIRRFPLLLPQPPGSKKTSPRALDLTVPSDTSIPRALALRGLAGYEPEALAVVLGLLGNFKEPTFFDIGANAGPFCLIASALTRANVYAFEPAPALAETLRRIRKDNGLKFDVEELAFGAESGRAELFLSTTSDASNSLRSDFRPHTSSVEVEVETLDGYCARTGRIPDVMKVDTESTEPEVLRGARSMLEKNRPWIICEVLAGRTENALEKVFAPLDYHWYQIGKGARLEERSIISGDPTHAMRDWLFAPTTLDPNQTDAVGAWFGSLSECVPL